MPLATAPRHLPVEYQIVGWDVGKKDYRENSPHVIGLGHHQGDLESEPMACVS